MPGTDHALEFDHGIRATPRELESTSYDVTLGDGWTIGFGINGGMLLATIANALRQTLPASTPDPVTISGYYLSASRPGPARVETSVLREGRSMSTGQASLFQTEGDGTRVERVRALATYGDLDRVPADVRTTATAPAMPPPEDCISSELSPPSMRDQVNLLERFDLRMDPAYVGWAYGQPSGTGRLQGWLRMADGREPDPILLLLAVDALPPVTFDLGLFGWAPTLELTAHVRARPAPGWLAVTHSTRNLAGGMFEEDAEVWDSTGRLVAQSRQLARAPRPQKL